MLEKTINNAICALLFRCEQQSVKEMDKIHAMQLFIKVAELESFSRAADFFALPKGSVSRQIQALEHQLGTQLLQRTTRRVKLTPEGMTYYQRAKDVLSNLSELDGLFQQDATSISGKLRIDIPPGIAKSLLLPRLSEFLYLHPGIELELSSHDRPVDILHDGFDCVIRTGALPEDGVIARPLGKLTMVNCASPHYLTRFGYPQSPDDLTSHAIVRYTPHLGVHPLGFEVASVNGVQWFKSGGMSLMLSMLRSSDVLARLGGDEFGLLLPDCNVESARFIATRIISAVNDYHFIWEGRVHRVGASAGITLIDDNNHQAAEVMSQADIACYASKNGGRGRVTVYEPQQAAAHSERAAMSLDEQWRMIKENQLMMMAHGVASPRIPEARNLWLISLKLWSCEGEIIDEQKFRRSFSDPALSHALDRRVFHEFFQLAAKAVASKGISIALPLSVAGLSSATLVNDLLEQLENSPLPPRLLHLIIPAEAILDHAESVQKLRLAGCRIVLSQVGRDLQIFNSLKANMADYLLLDGELCANVQGNLMDEMLITIIQGHAQRLGMKTIAGPVVLPLVMDTLSGIGVDLIYGDVIADAQPLDLLVNSSYFAIN